MLLLLLLLLRLLRYGRHLLLVLRSLLRNVWWRCLLGMLPLPLALTLTLALALLLLLEHQLLLLLLLVLQELLGLDGLLRA